MSQVNVYDDAHRLARSIQGEVARAIQDTVGMKVEAVNVHIEDVLFSGAEA